MKIIGLIVFTFLFSISARAQNLVSLEQAGVNDFSQLNQRMIMVAYPQLLDLEQNYDANERMAYSNTGHFYRTSEAAPCAFSLSPAPDFAANGSYALDPAKPTTWTVAAFRPAVKIVGVIGQASAECEKLPVNFRRICRKTTAIGSIYFSPDQLVLKSSGTSAELTAHSVGPDNLVQCLKQKSVGIVDVKSLVRLSER